MNALSVMAGASSPNVKRAGKTPRPKTFDQSGPALSARSSQPAAPTGRPQEPARPERDTPTSGGGKPGREIVFQLDNKSAREVLLAGCFTNWDEAPIQMRHNGGGSWQTKVVLAPGRYHYKFLVDGNWQDDPRATARCPNPFGTCDSVLEIK